MATSEFRATEIIKAYGFPRNQEVLHAMLAYAHQQGKVDGTEEVRVALNQTFAQQEAKPVIEIPSNG